MRTRDVILLLTAYFCVLVGLSVAWEFWVEDILGPVLIPGHETESLARRLEFVVTVSLFAALGLVVPGGLLLRGAAARRQVEAERRRMMAIAEVTPDLLGVWTLAGAPILLNPAAQALFAGDPGGRPSLQRYLDSYTPRSRELLLTRGIPAAKEKGLWTGETEGHGPGGSTVPYSEIVLAPRNAEGEVAYLASIRRDISEQKELERLKADMMGLVSHEIRTPLTSIKSALALVTGEAETRLSPDAAELLAIAANNTDRLVRLVNDVLDLEKVEAGAVPLNRERIALGPLLREVVRDLSPIARETGVRLVLEEGAPAHIHGDRSWLGQAVTNLVGNALNVSAAGDAVTVSLGRTSAGAVRVAVRDQGPGLPPAERHLLFHRFTQGAAGRGHQKGTGLGLAIAKAIVERHGGQIGVESEEGQGSEFYFELPAAPPEAAEAGPAASGRSTESPA